MVILQKIKKISRFVGYPYLDTYPVFLNSMPKAGTNLMENFLVLLGYKRNLARCLNESNISSVKLHPSQGRFYIGHIVDDDLIHSSGFLTIYLKRDLWSCLKSYVNYMSIDHAHPVSQQLRMSPTLETVRSLFFTSNNPNGRPLVEEYLRFYSLDLERYQLSVEFSDLVAHDPKLVARIAQLFELKECVVKECMIKACKSESYTKNIGRINMFGDFDELGIKNLEQQVIDAELRVTSNC